MKEEIEEGGENLPDGPQPVVPVEPEESSGWEALAQECLLAELAESPECDYTPTMPDQEVLQDSYPSPEPLQDEAKKEMKEGPTKNSKDEEEQEVKEEGMGAQETPVIDIDTEEADEEETDLVLLHAATLGASLAQPSSTCG